MEKPHRFLLQMADSSGLKNVTEVSAENRDRQMRRQQSRIKGFCRSLFWIRAYLRSRFITVTRRAFFTKCSLTKTFVLKSDEKKTFGFKQIKDRITVLLHCNRTGNHKLKPLVIGKFEKPRCFYSLNRVKRLHIKVGKIDF